jgi:L-ascorbate metabolism protein UlaG (beta-lactamase superfamily)
MDRHEAADMAAAIGPALVLPVHYDTPQIERIDADAEAFKRDVEATGVRVVLV